MVIAFISFVVVLLLAANALYVAAEFAAVSVRRSRIRQLAADGDRMARSFQPVIDDRSELDRYVAACQIGITLTSLTLGAYGQATIAPRLSPTMQDLAGLGPVAALSVAALVVLVVLTILQVVLGELVPKSLALQFPVRVSLLTVVPMRWSLWILRPFIWLLNGSGLAVLRLLRAQRPGHGHVHSPEEIELLIAQGDDGGSLTHEERLRLRSALHLGSRPAYEVMIPRRYIEALNIDEPLDAIVATTAASPYTRLPVYRDSMDNIIGILHSRDLVKNEVAGRPQTRLEPLLLPPTLAPETLTIDRLLTLMRSEHAEVAILVDEFGGVSGLVTLADVLAELFGEFGDEFKEGQPSPEHLVDGAVRLPGLLPLEHAMEHTGVVWDGSSHTVGGHVMEVLGRVPQPGERVSVGDLDVTVERVDHHAVYSVLVRRREGSRRDDG